MWNIIPLDFPLAATAALTVSIASFIQFWYTDGDKRDYEKFYGVRHSHCHIEYGLKRTGCVGCPFNPRITEELEIIKEYEPNLYTAAIHIFGQSYEYTHKYRDL